MPTKYYKSSLIVICLSLLGSMVLFCYGQITHSSRPRSADELYKKLSSIADEISDQLYVPGSTNIAAIGALKAQCRQSFDESGLTEDDKTQFLLRNIKSELSELEKREVLLRILLSQLPRQKGLKPGDVQFFAPYLRHTDDTFDMQDSILICLLSIDHDKTPIFTNSPDIWKPVWEANLSPRYTGSALLRDSILFLAQDEHWKPYGNDNDYIFNYLTPDEDGEISRVIIGEEKYILARRFLDQRFP